MPEVPPVDSAPAEDSDSRLVEALNAYLAAPTRQAQCEFIRTHADVLLSSAADHRLWEEISALRISGDPPEVAQLRHCRLQLWRCRHEGIDAGLLPVPSSDAVNRAVAAFVTAAGHEQTQQLFDAHWQELFQQSADRLLYYSTRFYQDDWPLAYSITRRLETLRECRQQAATWALAKFLQVAPGQEREEFALAHPELLWPEVAYSLAYTEQTAPDEKTRQTLAYALDDLRFACAKAGADLQPTAPASQPTRKNWSARLSADVRNALAEVRRWEVQLQNDPKAAQPLVEASEQALAQLPPTVAVEARATLHAVAAKGYFHWDEHDRRAHLAQGVAHAVEALGLLSPRADPAVVELAGTYFLACLAVPPGEDGPGLATVEQCWQKLHSLVTPARDAYQFLEVQKWLGKAFKACVGQDRETALRRAAACFRDGLRHLPSDADSALSVTLEFELGDACYQLSNRDGLLLHRAIDYFHAGLSGLPPTAEPGPFVQVQHTLGWAYMDLPDGALADNLEQAIRHLEEALRLCTPASDALEYAALQNDLGNACRRLGTMRGAALIQRAIAYYEEALRHRPEKLSLPRAKTLNNLGLAYAALPGDVSANLRQAIAHFRDALRLCPPALDPIEHGRILGNLGYAYIHLPTGDRLENLRLAIAYYQEAVRPSLRHRLPHLYARDLARLGSALINAGSDEALERAIRYLETALRIHTRERFPLEYGMDQMNLAGAWAQLHGGSDRAALEHALTCLDEALAVITPEDNPRLYGIVQMNRGSILDRLPSRSDPSIRQQVIACYEKALTVFRPAEEHPADYANAMHNLGMTYAALNESEANFAQAVHCCREALRFRKAESDPYKHRDTQASLGRLYFHKSLWTDADTAYGAAIAVDERLFKTGGAPPVWDKKGRNYPNAAFSAAEARGAVEGLRTLERGQARALAAALRLGMSCPAGVPPEVWSAFEAASQGVRTPGLPNEQDLADSSVSAVAYAERLEAAAQARVRLDAAIAQIRTYAPDFLKEFELADVLEQLDDETALVALCVTSQGSKAFLVTRQSQRPSVQDVPDFKASDLSRLVLHQANPDGSEVDGWVAGYLLSDRDRWRTTMDRVLRELGRNLLAPIVTALESHIQHLVLVGGGRLALLPLHAAILSEASGEYLADRYRISYSPSLQVLAQCLRKARRPHGDDWYAVVNPRQDTNLPYSWFEAATIGAGFQTMTLRAGPEATRAAFCAEVSGRAYVHFSGHGGYNWLAPNRSGLELADGRLHLADLQAGRADLSAARLVSLSACETGLIDVLGGTEGEYVGLPAGFLLAGVPCVVSTLWKVPELSSALLMERFYANYRAGRLSLPAALAAAQRSVRTMPMAKVAEYAAACLAAAPPLHKAELYKWHRYYSLQSRTAPAETPFAHPYYWAAFTVNGA